jgi:hypothetical protein
VGSATLFAVTVMVWWELMTEGALKTFVVTPLVAVGFDKVRHAVAMDPELGHTAVTSCPLEVSVHVTFVVVPVGLPFTRAVKVAV